MAESTPRSRQSSRTCLSAAACERSGPVSGSYVGQSTSVPVAGQDRVLELRVDVDGRYPRSVVLNRVSGDLYQLQRIQIPGQPARTWRVYLESWIVEQPEVTWAECHVEIVGEVRYWRGIHPSSTLRVVIPWRTAEPVGPASVSIGSDGGEAWEFVCQRVGDWFREMNLETAICQSIPSTPLLPTYDTHAHDDRPSDLPQRNLSVEECYREAGVSMRIRAGANVIDDSAPGFATWSAAELHDAMETHFSQYDGPWPNWEMWGLLAGTYDNPGVGGVMFDAAANFGGAGRAPDRQGFAVFRNHTWFRDLPTGAPANQTQAEALRKYLYTWVHEAGHSFNFLHSWDKNRPDALSWMNYDWKYDGRNGSGKFWKNFYMRFDEEELLHLRHGDRSAVMMGGDPWASGGHAEGPAAAEHLAVPPGAMVTIDGQPPLELLLRSKGYFEFMEPVHIEFRLRNLLRDIPLTLDTRMSPEYGGTTVYIRRPDGRIVEYDPIMCLIATPEATTLAAAPAVNQPEGDDRFSQEVFLSYGKYGFYFDAPGEYLVRAVYRGGGDVLIPSNMLRLRIGSPQSKSEDKLAQDFFTYEVGMALYLGGSLSPHLKEGMELMKEMVDTIKGKDSMLKARLSAVLAAAISKPFHRVQQDESGMKVELLSDAQPEVALDLTADAVATLHREKSPRLNLAYRQVTEQRVSNLVSLGQVAEAKKELANLQRDLKSQGANPNILEQVKSAHDRIL